MTKNSKIILIVVLLILAITGTYLYAQDFFISPEEKLMKASKSFKEHDSYTIEADIDTEMIGDNESSMNFKLNSDVDVKNAKAQGNTEFNFNIEGAAAKLAASYTYLDDDLYLNVDTFPYLFLPLDANQVELIVENDILIKENLIKDTNNYLADFLKSREREPKTVEEIISEIEEYSEDIFNQEAVIVEEVKDDTIEGKKVKRYTLSFDGERLNEIYLQIMEDYKFFDLFSNLSEEEIAEIKNEMKNQMKESYETMEAYAWIDGGNFVKTKTVSRTSIGVDSETVANQNVELPEEVVTTTNIYYKNFNEQFNIEAPTDFITREELINELNLPALLSVFNFEKVQ